MTRVSFPKLNQWIALGLIVVLSLCFGMLNYSIFDKTPLTAHQVTWKPDVRWTISEHPSHQLYARRTINLANSPEIAWMQISGDQRFQVYVNGALVLNSGSDIFEGVSDQIFANATQSINESLPYRPWEDPANYQHPKPNNWKMVTYIDLCSYLTAGKNVIAVSVENSLKTPRFAIEGEIIPTSETSYRIPISTGIAGWVSHENIDNWNQVQWNEREFPDQKWSKAAWGTAIDKATYSNINPQIYQKQLQGQWITGNIQDNNEIFLQQNWFIKDSLKHKRAFIRFSGFGNYSLLLNRQILNQASGASGSELKVFEVTNALRQGENHLTFALKRSLITENTKPQEAPLKVFLDGWVTDDKGQIYSEITTNNSWLSHSKINHSWQLGEAGGETSRVLYPVKSSEFNKTYEGDAYNQFLTNHLFRQGAWFITSFLAFFLLAILLGKFWVGVVGHYLHQMSAGASLLLPSTFYLLGIGLLKHRFSLEETGLLFSQANSHVLIFVGFLWILCLTLILSIVYSKSSPEKRQESLYVQASICLCLIFSILGSYIYSMAQYGQIIAGVSSTYLFIATILGVPLILLFTILFRGERRLIGRWTPLSKTIVVAFCLWGLALLGLYLRLNHLEIASMVPDEATSYDTARHIVSTGKPLSTSGIWYTRSPAYHYMLAAWMTLFGASPHMARLLTVLWGVISIFAMYGFSKIISQNRIISLLMAFLITVDPWEITTSRIIRFYQPVQCLSLITFILFFKGFVYRQGRIYQHLFFAVLTFTLLCQEVTVVLLPSFLIGFVFFYRPFRPMKEWTIFAGSIFTMMFLMVDLLIFEIKCKTPFVALSTTTGSMIQPHFLDVADFTLSLFAGPSRIFIIYGLFALAGLIYFILRQNGELVFLFSSVLSSVLLLSLLVMEVRNRYLYPIYPIFIFIAVYGAIHLCRFIADLFEQNVNHLLPLRTITFICLILLFGANLKIGDTFLGGAEPLYIKQEEAISFIKQYQKPGDLVMVASSQIAAINLEKVDYFLATGSLRFDIYYKVEGHVVDRWAQAKLISSQEQLNRVLDSKHRAWIMLSDTDPSAPPAYQGFKKSIELLGKPMMDTYGVQVRLWDPSDGIKPFVPQQGKELATY